MTSRPRKRASPQIEALTQEPGFWDDGRSAQKVLREADGLRSEIATWQELLTRADDLLAAVELLYEAPDAELEAELERDVASLETDFARERTALLFSGEYDERPALLSISAGAGGTEATDWTEMLLRMYLRWAERHRFPTEILDQQEGEQAGLKSVTVAVNGRRAYGWLRAERGVHRLVRISPFDSQNRRQTTFALVEVLPEADDDVEIELDWDQIRVDTFRSQGAGGQHVNKTDSAVRLTDLPTGIVAQSQNERSQTQNKEMAIKVLKSRLLERALEEKEEEVRELKGEHVEAGWGNQIRSYVLHPYQMVKDLRTDYETGNTGAVLDGDLDAFMQAELERGIGEEARRLVSGGARRGGRSRAARRVTFRPARPTSCRPAPRSGGSRSTTTSCRLGQAEIPPELAPLIAAVRAPPGDRPGAVRRRDASRDRAARERVVALRARRSSASGSGTSRCCSCCPSSRAPASAATLLGRVLPDRRRHGPGDRDRQRPADLERAVRDARDGAADAAAEPDRAAATDPRRSASCRPASCRSRSTRSSRGPPGRRRPPRCWSRPIDALDRELLGVAHPVDHRFLRSEIAPRLAVPRPGRRRRSATATPARPAGRARSPSATRRCSARSSGT